MGTIEQSAVSVNTGPVIVPGAELLNARWLGERIAAMGGSWGTGNTRVAGTLWWCMAASSLVAPVVGAYAAGDPAPDSELERISCEIRPDGGVERVFALGTVPADGNAGQILRHTLSRVIPVVAEVTGAGVASLWAIVADAIGNRALDLGDREAGARLARDVAGRLPVPRFSDVGARTFVRRISCCLVFEVSGCEMCTSCPKRPAAQREALLTELAARGEG
ncbi:(2Fe-2S)-binding protein [Nocardia sp. NPDC005978]|uniref:(2Fe-2S)-binding protein n=1 Tax=Nocardia sp. NPDC005978 TaxID=3156725 RepID=UPI00339DE3DB